MTTGLPKKTRRTSQIAQFYLQSLVASLAFGERFDLL